MINTQTETSLDAVLAIDLRLFNPDARAGVFSEEGLFIDLYRRQSVYRAQSNPADRLSGFVYPTFPLDENDVQFYMRLPETAESIMGEQVEHEDGLTQIGREHLYRLDHQTLLGIGVRLYIRDFHRSDGIYRLFLVLAPPAYSPQIAIKARAISQDKIS